MVKHLGILFIGKHPGLMHCVNTIQGLVKSSHKFTYRISDSTAYPIEQAYKPSLSYCGRKIYLPGFQAGKLLITK